MKPTFFLVLSFPSCVHAILLLKYPRTCTLRSPSIPFPRSPRVSALTHPFSTVTRRKKPRTICYSIFYNPSRSHKITWEKLCLKPLPTALLSTPRQRIERWRVDSGSKTCPMIQASAIRPYPPPVGRSLVENASSPILIRLSASNSYSPGQILWLVKSLRLQCW